MVHRNSGSQNFKNKHENLLLKLVRKPELCEPTSFGSHNSGSPILIFLTMVQTFPWFTLFHGSREIWFT